MNDQRKGKFTRGPVETSLCRHDSGRLFVETKDTEKLIATLGTDANARLDADGELIRAAFNSATQCEDLGLNGAKCVEMLPKLVKHLDNAPIIRLGESFEEFRTRYADWYRDRSRLLYDVSDASKA